MSAIPVARRRSIVGRLAAGADARTRGRLVVQPASRGSGAARTTSRATLQRRLRSRRTTLGTMTDLTEAAVARRVPSLAEERLRVLSRRQPVTVAPGTSLAECIRSIQRTGTGDS